MAEIQRQRIKSIYGELAGILSQLPLAKDSGVVHESVIDHFNGVIKELGSVTRTDYSHLYLTSRDTYNGRDGYLTTVVRPRIGAIVKRLEEEYDFGQGSASQNSPVVVTIQQNQSVNVTVIPIQQLISSVDDEELRELLNSLRDAVEKEKNPTKVGKVLTKVMEKSWEVFILVLPYILEHMGKHQD